MMLSAKRKYSSVEDSDDDEPTLGKQVLPVANLPADFSGVPKDGMEYLFTVRRDARLLPYVTRVVNPYEIEEEARPIDYDAAPLSTPHSALPSEGWREVFVSRLRNFRKNIVQSAATHGSIPSHSLGPKLTPDMKERDHWWSFLTGRPEDEWNPPKKPKKQKPAKDQRYGSYGTMRSFTSEYEVTLQDPLAPELSYTTEEGEVEQTIAMTPSDSLPTPLATPVPPDKTPSNGMSTDPVSSTSNATSVVQPEPTPSLLGRMDHRYSLHLLMYFAHWINLYLEEPVPRVCMITETHARWMFALLSWVDDYLSADEMSTLRSLARGCIGLIGDRLGRPKSDVGPEDTEDAAIAETSCWLIIAAVTGLWGQYDLWQDAESMLADSEL
ncbi:uncharacterized protein PHACADRAFT_136695 [Phanerochaete carnosa HHB-10118-sp]|uniref:Uncharacterized protein n=1 Tax=Phanerochaete carnosa (strain HHB-10118-sp) TaxID=650164 RepID=K5X8P4_PHACS|nr:uncharacterized protein PHACADRAFT_136695 [Phanerochaete carnosa HHB-10118-sp]EKM59252.1 hypothetical protein PHACADRAFT_136695 [Phanerochaete carnosa HHB-10118-sp]